MQARCSVCGYVATRQSYAENFKHPEPDLCENGRWVELFGIEKCSKNCESCSMHSDCSYTAFKHWELTGKCGKDGITGEWL